MNTCCKAVIFDLDGTVLDTLEDLADSMNITLAKFGFPERTLEHHRSAIGNGIRKFAERCIPETALTDSFLDEFVKVAAEDYKSNSMIKTKPFDGINELFDFLSGESISISILSNKRNEIVNELMGYYFPDYNFDCVFGEIPGVPKKPNPTAALNIAQECGISPEKIVFIGDSIYDVITGKNAGMKTVAVTWGNHDRCLLETEKPDFIADNTCEIIQYIKNLNKLTEE